MKNWIGLCSLLAASIATQADVACPPIFSDHMVLQRDRPVPVWGEADPGEKVKISFGDQATKTTTGPDGRWMLYLSPMEVSAEPRQLIVTGKNTLRFSDVLVGEVWLCSGQSNMEKPLGEKKGQQPTDNHLEEIAAADHPTIRLFHMPHHGPGNKTLAWQVCSPESVDALEFSAVAYFFGVDLQRELQVPVGLIDSSFGGTMIEAWMPAEAFDDEQLVPLLERKYFAWVEGVQATELFTSMIEPLAPFALRGFLWYQGESNLMDGDTTIYADKQLALMKAWRQRWRIPDAPFYFVQLAPFNYSEWTKFPKRQTPLSLPAFWEAQAHISLYPNTGMVATTDLAGDATDIHPTQKKEVGQRLTVLALKETFGCCDLIAHSPVFTGFEDLGNGQIGINFTNTGSGLASRDGHPLTHFQMAGASGHFYPATAVINGPESVIVSAPEVNQPRAVRFGWDETANPNLVNSAGLPAVPFRSDRWPVQVIRQTPKPSD